VGVPIRHSDRRFTWADYRSWPDDERWEIIAGVAYAMAPSPSVAHQEIVSALNGELRAFLEGRPCDVLPSPMDVKLSDEDVVQPDLLVYCDPSQNKDSHIEGPPAIVIEVLSPGSQQHDRMRKLHLYARAGVKEYWIVGPKDQLVEVLVLKDGRYTIQHALGPRDDLVSPTFDDMRIPLAKILVTPPYPDQVREGDPTGAGAATGNQVLDG